MKIIHPGRRHWSCECTCLSIQCRAVLEVEEKDLTQGLHGIVFTCPECGALNIVPADVVNSMPEWTYNDALKRGLLT